MGVDWLTCRNCEDTFSDCGHFVGCDCGNKWCTDDCAEADGYKTESCKLGYDTEDNECEKSCYNCDEFLEKSCKYCREEDFEDYELLKFALNKLGISRENLIEMYKENKEV